MAVFPSKEWVAAVLEAAAEKSEKYKEAAKVWEGDFLCICKGDEELLRELNRKEIMAGLMSFVDMIPAEGRKKYKGTPTGDIFETLGIPLDVSIKQLNVYEVVNEASKLSAEDIRGVCMCVWIDFWHGTVRNLMPVAPGEHEDAAFKLSGDYSAWKLMASGKQDAVRLILSNKLKLERFGQRMLHVMRHMKATVTLTNEVFAEVPINE